MYVYNKKTLIRIEILVSYLLPLLECTRVTSSNPRLHESFNQ